MNEITSEYDIDSAWSSFCEDGNIDNDILNNNIEYQTDIPKSTDIYISTKTKIAYLSQEIDLDKTFWNTDVIHYHKQEEGVVKKQMKFNFTDEESVNTISKKIENLKNVDEHIISRIVNPTGRIKFRDIRKISIGLCQKDILSFRSKKRSAFYNCFVLILRVNSDNKFKEIHVKVFNTGKLEIPGIRDDDILIYTLELLVKILRKSSGNDNITYDLSKSETVLINSNFNCGFYLNRDKLLDILKYKYKIDCLFDSCQYPGIQCKYNYEYNDKKYKLSFMIFRTGSILIVGKCDEVVLFKVYDIIKEILENEYNEIYVNNFEKDKVPIKLTKKTKKRIIYVS